MGLTILLAGTAGHARYVFLQIEPSRRVDPGELLVGRWRSKSPLFLWSLHTGDQRSSVPSTGRTSVMDARSRSLRKYGLTPADYDEMVETQNGRCMIWNTDRPGTESGPRARRFPGTLGESPQPLRRDEGSNPSPSAAPGNAWQCGSRPSASSDEATAVVRFGDVCVRLSLPNLKTPAAVCRTVATPHDFPHPKSSGHRTPAPDVRAGARIAVALQLRRLPGAGVADRLDLISDRGDHERVLNDVAEFHVPDSREVSSPRRSDPRLRQRAGMSPEIATA